LHKSQGRQVGYKAGLTNKTVQQRFSHDAPLLGVLLEKMLLKDGSTVSSRFGARPLMEADLIVEVKDDGINRAKTPAEVMNHLSRLMPFIELPDLILDPRETLNGPNMIAINVGARLGVMGKPFAASPALIEPLAEMTVLLRDQNGVELGKGAGSAILGHPLNAVIWIAQDLAKSGQKLKAGDLLSLGSFSAPIPPKAGQQVTAIYAGLPGAPSVSVRFK
jgi:2-keto-4-pentenoate hydratase